MTLIIAKNRGVFGVLAILLPAVLLCSGCSSEQRVLVHGKISRTDGSPVVNAGVMFRGKNDDGVVSWASGVTDDKGEYNLGVVSTNDGIPPGVYSVMISEDRGSADAIKPRTVLAKYEKEEESGLQANVVAGELAEFDFKLDPIK